MSERRSIEQSGVFQRVDGSLRRAHFAAVAFLASTALGGGMAANKAPLGISVARAQTPSKQFKRDRRPAQVQEFISVKASDPGGAALELQRNTFMFTERCKDNGRLVSRSATYQQANQPLGKCDVGSPVTVTEKPALRGQWVHRSGTVEKIAKATRSNNHKFVFVEQQAVSNGSSPQGTPPSQPSNPGGSETTDPYASGNVGVDISWPQCGTSDATPRGADFGIVDVNNGLGYSTNPCLTQEASAFPGKQLNLYVNTGWNSGSVHIDPNSPDVCGSGDENCLAYNYGYNAGLYAVNAATSEGVNGATRWWLDVESNATWASDTTQNQNSLQGEHDALLANGATDVGVYSTTVQWGDIAGGWQNNWPSWGATTWTTAADAKTYCAGHEFTGGPSELMQFLPNNQLDEDVAC